MMHNTAAVLPILYSTLAVTVALALREHALLHSNAPAGTPLTLNAAFRKELAKYRGCYAKITGGDAPLTQRLAWSLELWNFETKQTVPMPVGSSFEISLGFFCADGNLRTFSVVVNMTTKNECQPRFEQPRYAVYVPVDATPNRWLAKISASDSDLVQYNAKVRFGLSQTNSQGLLRLSDGGDLYLTGTFNEKKIYEPVKATMEVCDLGSPQLCAQAPLSVFPVTVTPPENVRVNTATRRYQIFEWHAPMFGEATAYKIEISLAADEHLHPMHTEHVQLNHARTTLRRMTRASLSPELRYVLVVVAVDRYGASPSEPVSIELQPEVVNCTGRCSAGGAPACFHSTPTAYSQFFDGSGSPQCICFPGFRGADCSKIEHCIAQSILHLEIGPVNWPKTPVNGTAVETCPYGPIENMVSRYCDYNRNNGIPEWVEPGDGQLSKCNTKKDLEQRLKSWTQMIDNHGVVVYKTVKMMVDTLTLVTPHASTDSDIGRAYMQVLARLSNVPWQTDNGAPMKERLWAGLQDKARHAIVDFAVTSARTLEPTDIINVDPNIGVTMVDGFTGRYDLGSQAFIQLSEGHRTPRRMAVAWIRNSSFYQIQHGWSSTANPVIEIVSLDNLSTQTVRGKSYRQLDNPIRFGMVPYVTRDYKLTPDYTCAYYCEIDKMWKIDGVKIVEPLDTFGYVVCETYHLSAFSILHNYGSVSSGPSFASSTWVLIGSSVASGLLVVVVVSLCICRSLRHGRRGGIIASLCLTKFILYGAYSLATSQEVLTNRPSFCGFVSVVVQWTALSSLLWLLIESLNHNRLSRRLTQPHVAEHTEAPCAMLRRAILAWGLPGVIISCQSLYYGGAPPRTSGSCGPPASVAFYYVPGLALLCFNSIAFVATSLRVTAAFTPANATNHSGPSAVSGDVSLQRARIAVSFIRFESPANFVICILFTICWGYESLAPTTISSAEQNTTFAMVYALLAVCQAVLLLVCRMLFVFTRKSLEAGELTTGATSNGACTNGYVGRNGLASDIAERIHLGTAAGADFLPPTIEAREFSVDGAVRRPLMYSAETPNGMTVGSEEIGAGVSDVYANVVYKNTKGKGILKKLPNAKSA